MGDKKFKQRDKLIKAREARGWTQVQLAEALGVSRRHIIFMESGEKNPSLPLAHKIAVLFDSTIDELFF